MEEIMKKRKPKNPLCSWMIPKFPRKLKEMFNAYCRANGSTVPDQMEDMVQRELREAGVHIPPLLKKGKS